ncbi:tyrosine-type recombinase/integrase [Limibaculum sp. FT325]|uniref:tyrosine-type recombinase/integrase n=1 Tax=Thermohalobaculum sediminis TaxID=2939436 RepID=UPI0020BEF4A8|nr:site-specific integrase [Limibaculum sediminis]MCL5778130.1 tyrosine-type recombinase/integrase [Limibaculum sediminis]
MPKRVYRDLSKTELANPEDGRRALGGGLYIYVSNGGKARSWVWRGVVRGRRREIGIGPVDKVSLSAARATALEWGRVAFAGGDPREERDRDKRALTTFAEAARQVHAEQVEGRATPAHARSWIASLEQHAFAVIGALPVASITQGDILRVLGPIWVDKPPTARLVRQRLAQVFDWATVAGLREGVNPCAGIERGLASVKHKTAHRRALAWGDVPDFFADLRAVDKIAARALQFQILTAVRPAEAAGATWEEIDLDARLWRIPAERMKARREHVVPLSAEALAVLDGVRRLSGKFPFPSPNNPARPTHPTSLQRVVKGLRADADAHGFRSAFRDWAEERGGVRGEVAEMVLAHVVGSQTVRAYRRADVLEERREALARWGRFVVPVAADVVAIR